MKHSGWTPWGEPRVSERGLETAYHHPIIALKSPAREGVQIINPASLNESKLSGTIMWRPMIWAACGRKEWRSFDRLDANTAFEGDQGHLYHTIDCVCEQLFEGDTADPGCVAAWISLMEERIHWCRERGIIYRHLVVPEHHAIYSDMIQDHPALSDQRPLRSISYGLKKEYRNSIIYPLDDMIEGRRCHDTSMRHDVHFTGYGCYICYNSLVESLAIIDRNEIITYQELEQREIFVGGDVARAMNKSGMKLNFHFPPAMPHNYIIKGTSFKHNQVDVIQSENAPKRKLLLFRTSNSSHLIPYLLRHFSRIIAVANLQLYYDLIEIEKPDVVVSEMPERYFAHSILSHDTCYSQSFIKDSTNFTMDTGLTLPLP